MAVVAPMLKVTVAWAEPGCALLLPVHVPPGATLRDAVVASGLPAQVAEIDLTALDVGVFGQRLPASHAVRDGDRIEVYRPLVVDPKEARRMRAEIRKRRRAAAAPGPQSRARSA